MERNRWTSDGSIGSFEYQDVLAEAEKKRKGADSAAEGGIKGAVRRSVEAVRANPLAANLGGKSDHSSRRQPTTARGRTVRPPRSKGSVFSQNGQLKSGKQSSGGDPPGSSLPEPRQDPIDFNFKDYKPFAKEKIIKPTEDEEAERKRAALRRAKEKLRGAVRALQFTNALSSSIMSEAGSSSSSSNAEDMFVGFPTNRDEILESRENKDTKVTPKIVHEADQRKPWRKVPVIHSESTMSVCSEVSAGCALEKEESERFRSEFNSEGSVTDNKSRRRSDDVSDISDENEEDSYMSDLMFAQQALGWASDDRSERSVEISRNQRDLARKTQNKPVASPGVLLKKSAHLERDSDGERSWRQETESLSNAQLHPEPSLGMQSRKDSSTASLDSDGIPEPVYSDNEFEEKSGISRAPVNGPQDAAPIKKNEDGRQDMNKRVARTSATSHHHHEDEWRGDRSSPSLSSYGSSRGRPGLVRQRDKREQHAKIGARRHRSVRDMEIRKESKPPSPGVMSSSSQASSRRRSRESPRHTSPSPKGRTFVHGETRKSHSERMLFAEESCHSDDAVESLSGHHQIAGRSVAPDGDQTARRSNAPGDRERSVQAATGPKRTGRENVTRGDSRRLRPSHLDKRSRSATEKQSVGNEPKSKNNVSDPVSRDQKRSERRPALDDKPKDKSTKSKPASSKEEKHRRGHSKPERDTRKSANQDAAVPPRRTYAPRESESDFDEDEARDQFDVESVMSFRIDTSRRNQQVRTPSTQRHPNKRTSSGDVDGSASRREARSDTNKGSKDYDTSVSGSAMSFRSIFGFSSCAGDSAISGGESEYNELWDIDHLDAQENDDQKQRHSATETATSQRSMKARPGSILQRHKWKFLAMGILLVVVVVVSVVVAGSSSGDGGDSTVAPSAAPTKEAPTLPPTRVVQEYVESQVIIGTSSNDFAGFAVAFSDDGSFLAVGYRGGSGSIDLSGAVRVFRKVDGVFVQHGGTLYGSSSKEEFGTALALSGDGSRLVVGARRNSDAGVDSGSTTVYEYSYALSDWQQIGDTIFGGSDNARSGFAVSMSGDGRRIAIGSPRTENDTGSASVYELDEASLTWMPVGQAIQGLGAQELVGYSVALSRSGDVLAVSALRASDGGVAGRGRVSVYTLARVDGATQDALWQVVGDNILGDSQGDQFGQSLALSDDGTRLVVGSNGHDSANGLDKNVGSCQVFTFLDGTWRDVGLPLIGKVQGEQFGFAVSISGDGSRIACGGARSSIGGDSSGVARVFQDMQGTWLQTGQDFMGEAGSEFGTSISLSGDGAFFAAGGPRLSMMDDSVNVGYVQIYEAR